MKSATVALCLGLLVVAGPVLASAQNIATGSADATSFGDYYPRTYTNVTLVAEGPSAEALSISSATNAEFRAWPWAVSVSNGDSGLAFADTEAQVTDTNTQSVSHSGAANFDGTTPTTAVTGAVANSDITGLGADTKVATKTDADSSQSGARSHTWFRDGGHGSGYGKADSTSTGPNARTGSFTAADTQNNQSSAGSTGFAVSGRKLRFN